jgi:glucose/arabinose dehydrogenase
MLPELCLLSPLANALLPTGFCVGTIPIPVNQSRTIVSLKHNSILALERGTDSILWISKSNRNSTSSDWLKQKLVTEDKINHGLAIDMNYLYASTDEDVYRWPYVFDSDAENFTSIGKTQREHVIYNISSNGTGWTPYGHMTRTLLFSPQNQFLYISVGSSDNIDVDSYRSRIRRFNTSLFLQSSQSSTPGFSGNITDVFGNMSLLQLPLDFDRGDIYVDGVRNTVGMAFDSNEVLWGADNGPSNLTRNDLGLDLNVDNPADRLFQFMEPIGKHYGYPYCFAEFLLPNGNGRGTSWAWPSFLNGTTNGTSKIVSDEECQTEYVQATIAMQGHVAPLGMTFYRYTEVRPDYCQNIQPFPKIMDGYAFIALHGSAPKSRAIPVGYSVVYIPMPLTHDTIYKNDPIPLLRYNSNETSTWDSDFRPVDVKFDDCGCLLVSSDGSKPKKYAGSKIVRIHYYDKINDEDIANTTTPEKIGALSSDSIKCHLSSWSLTVAVFCLTIIATFLSW